MEVGLDFGTTFSTLAFGTITDGENACLSIAGSVYIPTEIFIFSDGSYSIGNRARAAYLNDASGGLYINPKRWVGSNKRNLFQFLNRLKPDHTVFADGEFSVLLGSLGNKYGDKISVVTLISLFIKACILEIERFTNKAVTGIVCSVPAKYNSYKRGYLKTALETLGVPLRALINEPTAAVLFGIGALGGRDGLYGVFDFGGGTFDVSYALKSGKTLGIIGSEGDNYLGGRDIDKSIVRTIRSKVKGEVDDAVLAIIASGIKESVSNDHRNTRHLVKTSAGVEAITYTVADLDDDAQTYVARAINVFNDGLKKLSNPNITVVLTGGSSALPSVRKMLQKLPKVDEVIFDKNSFRASVALGAKLYSDILSGNSEVRLVDSLSQTLSDEYPLFQGKIIFPKDSPIPNKITTDVSGSGVIPFGVFEGEEPMTWMNEQTFKASYNSNSTKTSKMSVTYSLSIDGILSISVNGTLLENVFKVEVSNKNDLQRKYILSGEKYFSDAVSKYIEVFSSVHGLQIDQTDINNNSGNFKKKGILNNFLKSPNI